MSQANDAGSLSKDYIQNDYDAAMSFSKYV
jgi:hypothetical protein